MDVLNYGPMFTLTAGLLSDTHIPHRLKRLPPGLFDALAGCDVILHAGDVDDPVALEPLRAIAPVYAVRGNFHVLDLSDGGAALPATVELELAGARVVLVHGHQPGPIGFWLKGLHLAMLKLGLMDNGALNRRTARRLARLYPQADVIVFGHVHHPHLEWIGETLLVNPGAVCPSPWNRPTIARLSLGAGRPAVEVLTLALDSGAVRR
ncbi:MAG: YfcE family phosphodiesterase [Anaerolineae bacterium]|nr:YfcE family phosphodiesterase [Anaerolineae bacterium]